MRKLLAAALVLGLVLLPVVDRAAAAPGDPAVQLLFQTPWLQGHGLYSFHIGVPDASAGDRLQVTVYDQIRTRTDFDNAAKGQLNTGFFYRQAAPLSGLPPDPSGGFDIALPVNQESSPGNPFATVQIGETGVFAVQFAVFDGSGTPRSQALTSFIVFAQHTASEGAVKPLSAALVIPVSSRPVVGPTGGLAPPDQAETARLGQLGSVLNGDSSVAASILASPLTLDELGTGGSATGRNALVQLGAATPGGPFQVLPSTYSPVSLGDLQSSGLASEVQPQLEAGVTTLKAVFGVQPDESTWVVDGPLDGGTLGVLVAHHVKQVIVPDSDLTALPNPIGTTFARSTNLSYAGSTIHVVAADPVLSSDFTRDEPPVLSANQMLAEMAMIYTETPSVTRGVAVLPPAGWSPSPTFIQTLLVGLKGNPLISAVTASSLFSALGEPQGTRFLSDAGSSGTSLSPTAVSDITMARSRIQDLAQVLPTQSTQFVDLEQQVLLVESSTLTEPQRRAVLDAIGKATDQAQHAVSLPPATSITLTSTKGEIPLTILAAPNLHPRVELELRSQRLLFRPFSPKEGRCTVMTDTREICVLSLSGQNTTLKVPVETRSSGVFPLDVFLLVPGSGTQLAHEQNTVRSTAVSGVAVIVIGVALAGLILWWGRDLRRGRRPKGMVPSPVAEPADVDVTAGDPDVDGFFERPPPDYRNGSGEAMSPSGAGAGPSQPTDNYGHGRETREL